MWDGHLTKKAMHLTSIQLLQTPWQKRKTNGTLELREEHKSILGK